MEQPLTVVEVAAYLKVSKSLIYKLIERGKIPHKKVGSLYRFKRELIDRWLEGKENEENTRIITEEKDRGDMVLCALPGREGNLEKHGRNRQKNGLGNRKNGDTSTARIIEKYTKNIVAIGAGDNKGA